MLQSIRDKAQTWIAWVIVGLLCIPFALWGVNQYFTPDNKVSVAEVNGVELTQQEFDTNVRSQRNRLREMFKNNNMDLSFMEQQIRQSTLVRMVDEEVLMQAAMSAGLRISDGLLAQRIHAIDAFHVDGKFSQQRYEELLRYQGHSPQSFEQQMRRGLLSDQLRVGVSRSAVFTEQAAQQQAQLAEQQRAITYVTIPNSRFVESVEVTDAEIESYYKENQNAFLTKEEVSINYVEFSKDDLKLELNFTEDELQQAYSNNLAAYTKEGRWKAKHILVKVKADASDEDKAAAKTKADKVLAEVKAGEKSFEELAKEYSDDPSKRDGGNLGWFNKQAMVKPFQEAVEGLEKDGISELVITQFGYHIIKLEDKEAEEIKAFDTVKVELEKSLRQEKVDLEFDAQATNISDLAFESSESLDAVAQDFDLKQQTTGFFTKTTQGKDGDIFKHKKVRDAAFSETVLTERANSEAIEIAPQHLVIIHLKDHKVAKVKPLADVKENITKILTAKKAREATEGLGNKLMAALKEKDANPNTVVEAEKLAWADQQWVKRTDSIASQKVLTDSVFKLAEPAENTALYQGQLLNNGDYAIVALLAVKEGESSANKANDTAQQRQLEAVGESEFSQLVANMKAQAEIITYTKNIQQDS